MLNHVLFYIGVAALVIVGLIVAGSAFVSIYASIRNSKAELAEQRAAEASATAGNLADTIPTDNTNNHDEVEKKEVEEQ